ncbi:short-chain dehydrogenase/reductase [Aspergillus sclerotioniger CBS 115572]|uniref:Short-chain dehydrogenase/reductase n=1 Tax=Aspergillus sclerotioniger CBS 115572 TaxID=1450535 RepID=A0A317VVY6_9EURO|nr:short-chain dehydrogenase/reductase [Aspergillus sclerotioniger CBS 115572]PWY77187.1 short-chain dehydrogenase/reductase [Aspergillus sclerotioniger CBS 115572]
MGLARSGFALVTPASKGLGFAFARQLLSNTDLPVLVTARKNGGDLCYRLLGEVTDESKKAEERLRVFEVDVTDEATIHSMAAQIRQEYPEASLRIAITVPGVLHVEKSPTQIDAAGALHSFRVNALGPMLLMKHLAPFLPTKSSAGFADDLPPPSGERLWKLPSHAIYAMMAARVGSVSDNSAGGWYSYRASKASVFQLAKTFDLYLRSQSRDRAFAVAMHPGTVQTDFTKNYWDGRHMLQPDQSAERLLQHLCRMRTGDFDGRGRCWDWKGEEVLP